MKIAVVHGNFSPIHKRRLESVQSALCRGDTIVGIEIAGNERGYNWDDSHRQMPNAAWVTVYPQRVLESLSRRDLRRGLSRVLGEVRPDVVVVPGWTKWGLATLGWCGRSVVPRVLMSDSHGIARRDRLYAKVLRRLIVGRFNAAFVAGSPQRRFLVDAGMPEERCFDGCDAIDNDYFSNLAKQAPPSNKATITFLTCARLIPEKNLSLTLKYFSAWKGDWKWIISGTGPLLELLQSEINAHGLNERVSLVGQTPYARMRDLYQRADIYLQPSISETWGMAVNEAMASGLPIMISTRCGCSEDLVQQGVNGFTYEPQIEECFRRCLAELWKRLPQFTKMGQQSQTIIQNWGLELYSQSFLKACDLAVRSYAGHFADPLLAMML